MGPSEGPLKTFIFNDEMPSRHSAICTLCVVECKTNLQNLNVSWPVCVHLHAPTCTHINTFTCLYTCGLQLSMCRLCACLEGHIKHMWTDVNADLHSAPPTPYEHLRPWVDKCLRAHLPFRPTCTCTCVCACAQSATVQVHGAPSTPGSTPCVGKDRLLAVPPYGSTPVVRPAPPRPPVGSDDK